jgi:hypothetical protein
MVLVSIVGPSLAAVTNSLPVRVLLGPRRLIFDLWHDGSEGWFGFLKIDDDFWVFWIFKVCKNSRKSGAIFAASDRYRYIGENHPSLLSIFDAKFAYKTIEATTISMCKTQICLTDS